MIKINAVTPVHELDITIPPNQRPTVPQKSHIPGFYPLLMILGGLFLTLGVSAFSSVVGYLSMTITSLFTVGTEWNPMLAAIVIGAICFVIATIVFVSANRGKEISQRLQQVMDVSMNTTPKTFYDLSAVEPKYYIYELKKNGCRVYADPDGEGIHIHCDTLPLTNDLRIVLNNDEDTIRKYFMKTNNGG